MIILAWYFSVLALKIWLESGPVTADLTTILSYMHVAIEMMLYLSTEPNSKSPVLDQDQDIQQQNSITMLT